jgi:lipopolysaccharide/colanic/teichoic acid biosynthesis glycosyltransferase
VIRLLDVLFSVLALFFLWPLLVFIFVLCFYDTRAPIFCQQRVGRQQQPFMLFKFRTMQPGSASVATHLVDTAVITDIGSFLRRTKLDELPQLWNVLKGDMSLVGPRPCLFNQHELIAERLLRGVFDVRPGVTGRAQIIGIDMSTPRLLAETDALMLADMSVRAYLRYNFKTLTGLGRDFE